MDKIFIDTDIALDLLSKREPFYEASAKLFSLADKKNILIFISSLSFSNLNYFLTKKYNAFESRRILCNFKELVNVVAVDDKIIGLALNSKFSDFEDAIQYYSAIEVGLNILLTRNIKDYKHAEISILTANEYISHKG